MPRPLIGPSPLTPAERQARRRERFRETMAENERLRAALRVIAAPAPDAATLCVPDHDYWCTVAVRRQDCAREALAE